MTNNAVRRSARCATAQKRLHHNTSSIVFVLEQRLVFVALYTPPHSGTPVSSLRKLSVGVKVFYVDASRVVTSPHESFHSVPHDDTVTPSPFTIDGFTHVCTLGG